MDFLDPLPIKKMWGAGKKTLEVFDRLNIRTFKNLRQTPVEVLEKKFGKHGISMHQLSMGIDYRDVIPEHDVKSIGHELTFHMDIMDLDSAKKQLLSLATRVARRMRREDVFGKKVTLKVKYSDFTQITRSATLSKSTDDGSEIYSTVLHLLEKTSVGKRPVRLLGISLSQLNHRSSDGQLSLFDQHVTTQKRNKLNITLDSLHEKFGEKSIRPGTLITK